MGLKPWLQQPHHSRTPSVWVALPRAAGACGWRGQFPSEAVQSGGAGLASRQLRFAALRLLRRLPGPYRTAPDWAAPPGHTAGCQ